MLIYVGDTLINTDNIDYIRVIAEPEGQLSLGIQPSGGEPEIMKDTAAAAAFQFTMAVGSGLGIVNVEELWNDRAMILEGRAQTRAQLEQVAAINAKTATDRAASRGPGPGPETFAAPPRAQATTSPSVPTETGRGNRLIIPGKSKGDD